MTRKRRFVMAGILAVALAAAGGAVAVTSYTEREGIEHESESEVEHERDGHDPDAGEEGELPSLAAQHMEALPEDGGLEGPAGGASLAFLERAYPSNTISVAQMDTARTSFAKNKNKPFPGGKGQKGTWVSVGPTEALYPPTPLRNWSNYVPNAYVASGRTTAVAISDVCVPGNCRMYVTPAGGGIWRTDNAMDKTPTWTFLGGPLGINSAGAVTIDANDPTGDTVWVGTGEANVCASGCVAGVGLYKSTDGGTTWTGPIGKPQFAGNGIGSIVIKPNDSRTMYVGDTTALSGMSGVCCTGVTRPTPGAAQWGLYKSTDGGATWTFIHDGAATTAECHGDLAEFGNTNLAGCSPRGISQVKLDPANPDIVYAGSFARGIWRSADAGATWTQIKTSLNPAMFQTRVAFDVTTLPNGKTRMYVQEGNTGTPVSQMFRSDDVSAGAPAFTNLTSADVAQPGWAWNNLCTGQCWYDMFVKTPKGHPDMVYAGGAYSYGQSIANKRAVVLSTDAGVSGTDMTYDGTEFAHPNGIHPDQHDLVVNPDNPFQFFETSDGGIVRSSGSFVDRSAYCDEPARRLTNPAQNARCKQMLSRVPSQLEGINAGINSLQFTGLSVSPFNPEVLQGGTQDNGTWETDGNKKRWLNTMIGDGGLSGFDVGRPEFRFHTFTGTAIDVNFNNGNLADWIYVGGGQMSRDAGSNFYIPIISDPKTSGTMFAGSGVTAYRTTTFGLGTRTQAEASAACNEWTGTASAASCGDFARMGSVPLTDASWGNRAGPAVAAIARTTADTGTVWAATSTGRVFVTGNADAPQAADVTWTRLDDDAVTPGRFVSGISVDPANGNHAWISYSGFASNTPGQNGHVFEVTFDPATGTSIWVDRSYDIGDLPVTALARDDVTGDLYAGTDFGPLRLAAGTTTWTSAAPGMPNVEIAGLTILPQQRILYAATHGLGAWRLNLN